MTEDDDLLTAEQLGEKLGVKPDWIYTLVARDGIPYVRHGGKWWSPDFRFRWSEIEEWLRREGTEGLPSEREVVSVASKDRAQRRLLPWPLALVGVAAVVASLIWLPPLVGVVMAIAGVAFVYWWTRRTPGSGPLGR